MASLTLVMKDGPLAGERYAVDSELLIGRRDADVTVPDPLVSSRHARVHVLDGTAEIEDLGSLNGTWVNGQRIEGSRRLEPGDLVHVGAASFTVEGAAGGAGGTVLADRPPIFAYSLVLKNGPLAGRRLPVEAQLQIGRVEGDLTIDDPQVSSRHALVRPVDGGLELEDQGSLNGTWVNGERVEGARRVEPGDLVTIGGASFRVEAEPVHSPEAAHTPTAPGTAPHAPIVVPLAAERDQRLVFSRLAGFVSRKRKAVLAVWGVVVVVSAFFAAHQQERLSGGGWDVPGSESARSTQALGRISGFSAAGLGIVVSGSDAGSVTSRLNAARKYVSTFPDLRPGPVQSLPGGTAAILPLTYVVGDDQAIAIADELRTNLVQTSTATSTRVVGSPAVWSNYRTEAKKELAKGETIGFPIIFLILLLAFGTVVAAVSPLALGFVAVIVSGAFVYWFSRVYSMSIYVTNMASMIGIGVSVDYSLFILSRFRTELRNGAAKQEALTTALMTAGSAVVFSGATVVASLSGLFLIDLNAIRSMAIGAIVVVSIAVVASVTLLPALLSAVGKNVERLRVPTRSKGGEAGGEFWRTWTNAILRRPVLALLAGAAIMLTLAFPLLSIKTYTRGITLLPQNSEVRQATEAVQKAAGPGFTGPAHIVVGDAAAAAAIRTKVATIPGVSRVGPLVGTAATSTYLVEAFLTTEPESTASSVTVGRIETAVHAIAAQHGTTVAVGGTTAQERAIKTTLTNSLWKLILFIVAVSYIVLVLLLRSVVLPLKAVLMNMLSVAAAYGVLVAVFQWGWFDWTGYNSPGYIDTIVPALVLAVTFGLSMDYEVFLLSRIKERWLEHGDSDIAVAEGVQLCARIISSAALIMVAVFSAFAIAGSIQLRELGIGLAVAVGLDATIVRLVIVPSTMKLLGDWNWWLPAWLDRLIPQLGEVPAAAAQPPEASAAPAAS